MISSNSLALFNCSYLDHQPSGIGVVARELAHALDGSSINILDPIGIFSQDSIPIPNNLSPKFGSKGHLRRLLWTQFQLPKLIKQNSAEFLISPLPEAPLFRGIKSIVLVHDLLPLRYPQLTPLLSYHLVYVPLVVHRAHKVLCNSEATARELNQRLKVPYKKIVTIPLGYDSKKLYPMNLERKPFFLVLARHDPHKNIAGVIRAFSLLKSKHMELFLVGKYDKRYTPKLKELAIELGINHRCKWIYWVSDQERLVLLNSCKALVISSFWEGFGLPAIEAMACDTPVIASTKGAITEVIGDAGLSINPFNILSITDAMNQIITNENLVKDLIQKGRKRIKNYNWKKAASIIQDILV